MSASDDDRSGPGVARLFQCLLALVFLDAWLSLQAQLDSLIGSRGLLPVASFLEDAARRGSPTAWNFPSVFWLNASDTALHAGVWAGIVLAIATLAGWKARLWLAVSTALYLSYATAGRTFFSFQWDNLLVECGFLASFLPTNRPARWIHFLFRVVLFKLYWESGVAKWQSYLHDWHDGSAMTFYYETAPLPTWLGWYAHALPVWWHHLESRAMLVFELLLPFAIFGPRRARLVAFAGFSLFLVANIATANYGFFCYLAAALQVFLLGDVDVPGRWTRYPLHRGSVRGSSPSSAPGGGLRRLRAAGAAALVKLRAAGAAALVAIFLLVSTAGVLLDFGGQGAWRKEIQILHRYYRPWRLANTYHLFGHITRRRVEPEFQEWDGKDWKPLFLHYKPGEPDQPPRFAAPHQPRLDFQLWFYGLSYRRGMPEYVSTLLSRLCHDPQAVQPLFRTPLAAQPEAVRVAFWQFNFTEPVETSATGAWSWLPRRGETRWWRRQRLGETRRFPCRNVRRR